MSPRSARLAGPADAGPLFAALGDETRLALIARLGAGQPLSIAELSRGLPVTRQAVTKHLHVLSEAGLVRDFRRGRERMWEPDPQRLAEARGYLDAISKRWDEALERLRTLVEDETRAIRGCEYRQSIRHRSTPGVPHSGVAFGMKAGHNHDLSVKEPVEEPVREAPQELTTNVAVNNRSRLGVGANGLEGFLNDLEELVAQPLRAALRTIASLDVSRRGGAEDGRVHRRARSCLTTCPRGAEGAPFAMSKPSASDRRSSSAC
jgi:DNA-binding transcriptional ArsR family regulator